MLEVYEDYVVVECLDVTSGLLKAGTKTIVTKDVVSAKGAPEMKARDSIRIVYNGLKRTEPEEMKIVYAIFQLDANGEVISE